MVGNSVHSNALLFIAEVCYSVITDRKMPRPIRVEYSTKLCNKYVCCVYVARHGLHTCRRGVLGLEEPHHALAVEATGAQQQGPGARVLPAHHRQPVVSVAAGHLVQTAVLHSPGNHQQPWVTGRKHTHTYQCCSRVTMPRVRVQARVSSVRVQVKSKSLKKNLSRVRVESTTHTSQVRVEFLLIRYCSYWSRPCRVRVSTKAYMLLHLKTKHNCCATAHRRPNGGSYELSYVF